MMGRDPTVMTAEDLVLGRVMALRSKQRRHWSLEHDMSHQQYEWLGLIVQYAAAGEWADAAALCIAAGICDHVRKEERGMSIDAVTLEQARRLAALGYVGEFPQHLWERACPRLGGHIGFNCCCYDETCDKYPNIDMDYRLSLPVRRLPVMVYYPAPSVMQALDWLEREKGWRFWRTALGQWEADNDGSERFVHVAPGLPNTASALLDAILTALEGGTDVTQALRLSV